MTTYLVLDIETVPDRAIWSPKDGEPEKLKVEKTKPSKTDMAFLKLVVEAAEKKAPIHPEDLTKGREIADLADDAPARDRIDMLILANGPTNDEPTAPVFAQRPVAISYIWFDDQLAIKAAGTQTDGGLGGDGKSIADKERELLSTWSGFLEQNRPTIVTWGGRGFDLPVINLRSLRRGVQQRWYNDGYRNRYKDEWHLDLCDALTDFGAVYKTGFKLDGVAKAIGLPGKFGGMDGSKVAGMYAAGEIEKIGRYCFSDVASTSFVLFRYLLVKGRISLDHYKQAAASLLACLKAAPEHAEFVSLMDEMTLLLEA